MNDKTAEQLRACREAFERWAENRGFYLGVISVASDDTYFNPETKQAWSDWQAACNANTRADSGEAVADICNYKDMFESAVLALADIDRLLGLPEDGCNDPQVTVSALADFIAGHNDMQKYRDEWVDAQYASHPLDLSSITALVGEMFDEASELEDDGNIGMAEELRLYAKRFRVILAGADELQAAIQSLEVTPELVKVYCAAVNEHLGSLTKKQWLLERTDPVGSIERAATIGLTAVLSALKEQAK